MSILDDLTADLDWREGEFGSLKILLQRPDISPKQKKVLLRSAWAMLYAHYEGFVKFCLAMFYDEISCRVSCCAVLPAKTKALALDAAIRDLKNAPREVTLERLEMLFSVIMNAEPKFPDVDTGSNLWPSVFRRLLEEADLDVRVLDKNTRKIKTLVARRNSIAHGDEDIIEDVAYYLTFEEVIYEVMYELVYLIDERLEGQPYAGE